MLRPKGSGKGKDRIDKMLSKFFMGKNNLSFTRPKISPHPDVVTLANYINKSLAASQMKNIKAHLVRCPRCQAEVKSTIDAIRVFGSND